MSLPEPRLLEALSQEATQIRSRSNYFFTKDRSRICDSIAPHRGWHEQYVDLVEQSEPFPDRHESLVFALATDRQIYSRAVRNEMLRGFLEEEGLLSKGDSRELD